jgi:hypothetical protein
MLAGVIKHLANILISAAMVIASTISMGLSDSTGVRR